MATNSNDGCEEANGAVEFILWVATGTSVLTIPPPLVWERRRNTLLRIPECIWPRRRLPGTGGESAHTLFECKR